MTNLELVHCQLYHICDNFNSIYSIILDYK